jgi:hypothetical protein
VLISVTLLALVAGICYAAFHLGIRAVGKGEMAVVTAQRLRAATDVLIRQVKSAVASPALIDGDTYPYFYGTATSMSFVTEAGQLGGGGRARVTYSFASDPPQLLLEESPFFDAASLGGTRPEVEEGRTAVVLDGFRTMSFEFYDETDTLDCPSRWCTTWNPLEAEMLPAAIRIKVEGLFGLDEDVWGQEIPVMCVASTYAEGAGEASDHSDPQDCEDLETVAPSGAGQGTGPGAGTAADPEDADDPEGREDE